MWTKNPAGALKETSCLTSSLRLHSEDYESEFFGTDKNECKNGRQYRSSFWMSPIGGPGSTLLLVHHVSIP